MLPRENDLPIFVLTQDDHYVISPPPEHILKIHTSSFTDSNAHTKFVLSNQDRKSKTVSVSNCKTNKEMAETFSDDQPGQALDLSTHSFGQSFEKHDDQTELRTSPQSSVASCKTEISDRRSSFSVRNIMSLPERTSPPQNYTSSSNSWSDQSVSPVITPKASRRPFIKGCSFDSKLETAKRVFVPIVKEELYATKAYPSKIGKEFFGFYTF